MPFKLTRTDCSPLVIDDEYEIVNINLLAEYVVELLLGHHRHMLRVINSLSTTFPHHPDESIDSVIDKMNSTSREKRHGWLFQMISWLVLSEKYKGKLYYSNYPHFAPAQHGLDGLAIVLSNEDTIEKIIITEDKCTVNPRKKIKEEVFPEFEDFELGKKDSALVGIISSLIGNINSGELLENVQNDIFNKDLKIYRIGITRGKSHNNIKGRKRLFKNYDHSVKGKSTDRRQASSIEIEELRVWMEKFSGLVENHLKMKKTKNV